MASSVQISIPTTQNVTSPNLHTVYNISLRLPLRSFTLQKRYSDFTTLHSALISQAGTVPPNQLPPKSWFARTTSSPELTEERRKGLEAYLRAINQADNDRWRNTSTWRTFLNLPHTNSSKSSLVFDAQPTIVAGAPVIDPVVWLDQHRALKSHLHDARLALTRRDQASTTHAQHEASAQAKKCLVRAGSAISSLQRGLEQMNSGSTWGNSRLGEGELRRRKDLLSSASREKEGLDSLLSAMAAKAALDRTVASVQEKDSLLTSNDPHSTSAVKSKPSSGRVLGKETDQTRALDNHGVLRLQKQLMQEQDEDVNVLAQAVARQKELGIQIQEELEIQSEMLGMLDEDVTRVQGKMDVARKRIGKIS